MSRTRIALAVSAAAVVLAAAACAPQPESDTGAAASGSPDCTANSPGLHKRGQLTVATDSPAYAPWFEDNTPSNGKGFESAVAYAVAGKLGFAQDQVKWVVEPFAHSYAPGAKNFDFDINQISVTPQRAQAVDFSASYYTADQAVLTLDDSGFAKATSLGALKDARIGVQVATTSYQAVLDQLKPSRQPSVFNTTNDEVNALKNGQIDAIVTDLPTVFYLAGSELDNAKIVGQFGYAGGTPEEFGLLLPKDSKFTTCVNQALGALRSDGTLAKLTSQWLSASANVPELKP
ncbi:amino acid ABC transporter substrate-binding protein [Streptomyces subrutilus]|uniref:Amino acid ABC transporter substrate-binding protein n=1 Tax=Streptomyces subrutilus TaxID=36818 RepID=A0A5P2UY97_9ACTN|nr:ABC transporter substrate-binding protein [Streptomyces subrutilus]QEU81747.1 amino acid ABC transporter substrate-binding protein [Streptomyces subrutilus]GGZ93362.1 amino acid ABC transporter substrate-binding protein [Streptomyces subrutilus]